MFYRRIDEHLCLKLASILDAAAFTDLILRNREDFSRWFGAWIAETTADGERAYLAKVTAQWAALEELAAVLLLDGEPIGYAGLHGIDRTAGHCEIGYWLDAAHRGRGHMTAAVRETERLCFEELGLIRVAIHIDTRNERSRAIPERLGYHQDGILRAQRRDQAGTPHDEVVYSLLRDEWLAR